MILLLDHDDSFVFTLARYLAELGAEPRVIRATEASVHAIAAHPPAHILLSPGPGTPEDWPITLDIIRALGPSVPVLGVCLGHQCIAAACGASVTRSRHPRHGRTSMVWHDGRGVLMDVPSPFRAARYHSLAIDATAIPPALIVTAIADDGEIMGVRHREQPMEGVQFHPESVLTDWGHRMLANFVGVTSAGLGMQADQVPLSFAPCASTDPAASPSCS
ncbi:MAG: anthranilate synthase component II [Gemmatimonadales bacterium]